MKLLPSFRKPSVAAVMQQELDELVHLRYLEDRRRDYHAASVTGYDVRIKKLRGQLAELGVEK